jgi:predicted kinase
VPRTPPWSPPGSSVDVRATDAEEAGHAGHMDRSEPPSGRRGPTLTLFCGLPGAGKSTLARRLEAEGRGVRLSTDQWQADLGVAHAETDFHERLQDVLYRHALALLRQGVDVILEDGLWLAEERTAKFTDARSCSARIELHVFDVDHDTLWSRLRLRNGQAGPADYPMTEDELRRAWSLFQPPSAEELGEVDCCTTHSGGLREGAGGRQA